MGRQGIDRQELNSDFTTKQRGRHAVSKLRSLVGLLCALAASAFAQSWQTKPYSNRHPIRAGRNLGLTARLLSAQIDGESASGKPHAKYEGRSLPELSRLADSSGWRRRSRSALTTVRSGEG
jgi:hypothetical protein